MRYRAGKPSSYRRPIAKVGLFAFATALTATAAQSDDGINYTYDALGRVVEVVHNGSFKSGLRSSYQYDASGNRSNVTVMGATVATKGAFVVVPLTGGKLIKLAR